MDHFPEDLDAQISLAVITGPLKVSKECALREKCYTTLMEAARKGKEVALIAVGFSPAADTIVQELVEIFPGRVYASINDGVDNVFVAMQPEHRIGVIAIFLDPNHVSVEHFILNYKQYA